MADWLRGFRAHGDAFQVFRDAHGGTRVVVAPGASFSIGGLRIRFG